MTPPLATHTRRLRQPILDLLKSLKVGERIKLTQTVRVGAKSWPAEATGAYRGISYLRTGITTERVEADDVVVPMVQFTKDSGELASICLDEHTVLARA